MLFYNNKLCFYQIRVPVGDYSRNGSRALKLDIYVFISIDIKIYSE